MQRIMHGGWVPGDTRPRRWRRTCVTATGYGFLDERHDARLFSGLEVETVTVPATDSEDCGEKESSPGRCFLQHRTGPCGGLVRYQHLALMPSAYAGDGCAQERGGLVDGKT